MKFNEKLSGGHLVVQCTWSTNKSKGKKQIHCTKLKHLHQIIELERELNYKFWLGEKKKIKYYRAYSFILVKLHTKVSNE